MLAPLAPSLTSRNGAGPITPRNRLVAQDREMTLYVSGVSTQYILQRQGALLLISDMVSGMVHPNSASRPEMVSIQSGLFQCWDPCSNGAE